MPNNFLSNEYLNISASVPAEAVGSIILPDSEKSLIAELGISAPKKTTKVETPGYLEFTLYKYNTVNYEAGSSGQIGRDKKTIKYSSGTSIKIVPLFCLIKKDDYDGKFVKKYNVSSVRTFCLVGERCDPDTIYWVHKHFSRVLINDTWW